MRYLILICSDQSLKALLWTLHEFYRPGDCLHVRK